METIYSYTAKQAVEDGILIDVTEIASQIFKIGCDMPWKFRISVGVNNLCIPSNQNSTTQGYSDRLWDVLNYARSSIKNAEKCSNLVEFTCKIGRKNHRLWACLDSTSGPAIHIITPSEY